MDLDRITHPLRLAKGSHQPGSGKGCAMNVVSYINGDAVITDFPSCSARPLAAFVQSCNDLLAGPGGYLTPEHSVVALDLAWQTVGTAGVAQRVIHAWVAELLTSPTWGVVHYAKLTTITAIRDIGELHRRAARDDLAPRASWESARDTALAASRAYHPGSPAAGVHAMRAAYESTGLMNDFSQARLDTVTGSALRAHAQAAGHAGSLRFAEITKDAITAWRKLARLDAPDNYPVASEDRAQTPRYRGQDRRGYRRDERRDRLTLFELVRHQSNSPHNRVEWSRQRLNKLTDGVAGFQRVTQPAQGVECVDVAPPDLRLNEVAFVGQIGQNRLHGPFGDANLQRQLTSGQRLTPRNAQQYVSVVR